MRVEFKGQKNFALGLKIRIAIFEKVKIADYQMFKSQF